jgi:hypothetical protein
VANKIASQGAEIAQLKQQLTALLAVLRKLQSKDEVVAGR